MSLFIFRLIEMNRSILWRQQTLLIMVIQKTDLLTTRLKQSMLPPTHSDTEDEAYMSNNDEEITCMELND